ncbi:MAG: outer membrane protein assembly factor BamA [Kiloniellales bacterium]|nr:outer membrane protein assembly factor BamA [Kiloniellales bacterium]
MRRAAIVSWLFVGFIVLCAIVSPGSSEAQSILSGGTIEEIRIEGAQRVDPTTVRSYMRVNPGEPFDPVRIDSSLKSLFATGLFADVTLRREGNALIVVVTENPIINQIAFEGNLRIDDEVLEAETELRPRVVFTRTKVQNDLQRILELYRRQGRFAATVDAKVIQLEQNRVDLVFEINEGPTTKIQSINFIGNREFSDSTLRGEIATSESAFWRFLSTTDTFDPDRLTFDRELLRRFYLQEGYADFQILSAVAELTPDRESFIITFTLEEGQQYQFGDIEVSTTLKDLDPESLKEQVTTESGETYNATEVEDTITNLTESASNLGFAFVEVRPRVDRDRERRLINLTYEIREGPKVYVERIDIEGNIRTLDRVIRRQFELVEGDAFNASLLSRSRKEVDRLGFFKTVEVSTTPGSEADQLIITTEVEEQATGDLSFAAGFSTDSGPLGSITLRERNLLGRGQDVSVGFTLSAKSSQLNLSFTEPYFLDRDLSAGFDIFRTQTQNDESSFDLDRIGGSLRAGYDLYPDVRQVWTYTLEHEDIHNVDDDAAPQVQADQGTDLESSIGQSLRWDTRDKRFDPREGHVVRLGTTLAGFGGDVRYIQATLGGAYYYTIVGDLTASISSEVGNIQGISYDTKVSDRFFLGGQQLRGFKTSGVGPRQDGDALGGKRFYTGSLELSFPVGLPPELNFRGRVFSDMGAAWDVDADTPNIKDSSSPRVSVGTGFSWISPFGPVVVDLGWAVVEEDFDKTELFNFSFGTRF